MQITIVVDSEKKVSPRIKRVEEMDAKTIVAAMVLVMLSAGFLGVSVYLSIRSAPLPYTENREGMAVTQRVTLALLLQLALIIVGVFSWAIVEKITE